MAGHPYPAGGLWDDRSEYGSIQYLSVFFGIFLWFAVGVMWKDKAIMVVHVGAFISLLADFLNA